MSEGQHTVRVRLHTFLHQVSGTTLLLKFNDGTICKPLLQKEYNFYKSLPEDLKEFTAQYKGSIEIECEENPDGTIEFYGIVPQEKLGSLHMDVPQNIKLGHGTSDRELCLDFITTDETAESFRLKRSGSIELNDDSMILYDDPKTKVISGNELSDGLNRFFRRTPGAQRFILLENLVAHYTRPSILDLKMGTRTYADDDNPSKKASKLRKGEISTTRTHGVRLSGMQKFNVKSRKYETFNKQHGVHFTSQEFEQAVKNFIHDGRRERTEIIQPILTKLNQFHRCVSNQDTFRFYSSSLLIIYDGGTEYSEESRVDLRCIDFAHTISSSGLNTNQPCTHVGPDEGYLFGITSLIKIFEQLLADSSQPR